MHTTIEREPRPAFRNAFEQFTWAQWQWDIAKLQRDIDAGTLRPAQDVLDADFIDGYASKVLSLVRDPLESEGRLGLMMRVDVKRACALPLKALEQPLIMLHTPLKGHGLLRLNGQPSASHVLADGNHRLARAFFEGRQSLQAYILSSAQSRKYLV